MYLSHSVFNNPAKVTDSDTYTSRIQEPDQLRPRDIRGRSCRSLLESYVPDTRYDDEEAEDKDLKDQSTEDDVLAALETVFVIG